MKTSKLFFRLCYLVLIVVGVWWLGRSMRQPVPKDFSDVKHAIKLLISDQQIDPGARAKTRECLQSRYLGERGAALGLDFSNVIEKIGSSRKLSQPDKQQLSRMLEMSSELSEQR